MGEAYLFNYEDGTPKSLYDSLSFTRDHKTPDKTPDKRS